MVVEQTDRIFVGRGDEDVSLLLKYANRHGLVTGATGTGKTVTLQILTEAFSKAGVPVFAADIKGDLSGLAAEGELKDFLEKRSQKIGLGSYKTDRFPVTFWDLFGHKGHPIRTTVSEMGPLLLSRLLDLNDTQEGVLNIAFKLADEDGLLLLDWDDLKAILVYVAEHASELSKEYGAVSPRSVAAIQRQLLVLEQQGGEHFFGEPALDIRDMMGVDRYGYGSINILAADQLMTSPRLYATFLLWLLSELFEELPEVGDPEKPKLVFFFDEAHLLFDEAPKILLDRVEQVVRLIRSKGVGVFFVTQNPIDVPDAVSAQLGNRVQHALRAFTPKEQKAVRAAAETFRPNPKFDTADVITQLGVGEALVSVLMDGGVPCVVEKTLIRPPASQLGPISDAERQQVMASSPVRGKYDTRLDRVSAEEMLAQRAAENLQKANATADRDNPHDETHTQGGTFWDGVLKPEKSTSKKRSNRMSVTEVITKQVARSVASQVGNQIGKAVLRGILGSLSR